jgi:hypothetical protein
MQGKLRVLRVWEAGLRWRVAGTVRRGSGRLAMLVPQVRAVGGQLRTWAAGDPPGPSQPCTETVQLCYGRLEGLTVCQRRQLGSRDVGRGASARVAHQLGPTWQGPCQRIGLLTAGTALVNRRWRE